MATKINVRSPFYVKAEPASGTLTSAQMELYIYTGAKLTTPTSSELRYTITKTPIDSNNYVVYEIAELVRDYLDIEFDGEYDSQCVWVRPTLTLTKTSGSETPTPVDYIAFDGYGYFHEGTNPELSRGLLMSNNTIFRLNYDNVRIPVFTEDANSVTFLYKGEEKRTQSIPSAGVDVNNTNGQIEYITVSGLDDNDTYRERVVNDGGTLEDSDCLDLFLRRYNIGEVDEVIIDTDAGVEVVKINTINECKYEPYKVTFVNKYGALQDLWFFKKSVESTNVKSEQFKASIFDQSTLSYKTYKHQQQAFLAQGKDKITMNTGYVNDDHNAVLEELLLSEQVWYTEITETEERVIPVIPLTKSITYKTSVNDKLANYTVDFEHAFDKINNIR
jgi:hypothetical protein